MMYVCEAYPAPYPLDSWEQFHTSDSENMRLAG